MSFYVRDESTFYRGNVIDYHRLSDAQLDQFILEGAKYYRQIFPPENNWLKKVATIAVITAIVVVSTGALASTAAGGVTTAPGIAAGSSAASGAAAATASTASGVWGTMQTYAGYVSSAAPFLESVGVDVPEGLQNAANVMASPGANNIIESVALRGLDEQGIEIDTNNAQAMNALQEKINRERERYAANLSRQAQNPQNVPTKIDDIKVIPSWVKWGSLIGAGLMLIV